VAAKNVVLLGGECSNLLGPALALKRLGRYGVVYVDGHSDFRTIDNSQYVGAAGGEPKTAQVRQLGASHAIDYSRTDWSEHVRAALDGRPITLALDGVGGDIGRAALELVGVGGRLVMFGLSSGALTELRTADLYERGITVSSAIGARLVGRPGGHRSLEQSALKAAADGWLSPLIGHVYSLDEAADAHRSLAARTTIGKTVLRP